MNIYQSVDTNVVSLHLRGAQISDWPSSTLCWRDCQFSIETGTLGDKHLKALHVKTVGGLCLKKGLNTEMNK